MSAKCTRICRDTACRVRCYVGVCGHGRPCPYILLGWLLILALIIAIYTDIISGLFLHLVDSA